MRYSEYFVKVAELYNTDAIEAERLLREAEQIASQHIAYHLILCAKSWLEVFGSRDNSMRCMLEAECRISDCRGFIEIADWRLKLLNDTAIAGRCLKKSS